MSILSTMIDCRLNHLFVMYICNKELDTKSVTNLLIKVKESKYFYFWVDYLFPLVHFVLLHYSLLFYIPFHYFLKSSENVKVLTLERNELISSWEVLHKVHTKPNSGFCNPPHFFLLVRICTLWRYPLFYIHFFNKHPFYRHLAHLCFKYLSIKIY